MIPIRILTVDDHTAIRQGLAAIVDGEQDMRIVASATDGAEAIELYSLHTPDVVLMDLQLPNISGVEAIRAIGGKAGEAPLDVRDAAAVKAAFDAVERSAGPVDVFLNNAAGNFPVPAEDLSPNGFRTVVQIDLEGGPDVAREPMAAAKVAFAFWDACKCSPLADLGDVEAITEKVNGPAKLGLTERREATLRAMDIWLD